MLSELVEHVEDQLSNSLGSPKVSLCLLLTLLAALGMSVCGCKTMALHGAAIDDDAAKVESLIQKGIDANIRDLGGQTALHKAAYYGHTNAARVLLANGADVNARGAQGETALHFAAGKNHLAFVKLLLANGADVDPEEPSGWTPYVRHHYGAM